MALNQINLAPFQFSPVQNAISTAMSIPEAIQKMKLEQAQAQYYAGKAQSPFGGQNLTGDAAKAYSELLYKAKFGGDTNAMKTLADQKEVTQRRLNAQVFVSMGVDERNQTYSFMKGIGMSAATAANYFSHGGTVQEAIDAHNKGLDMEEFGNGHVKNIQQKVKQVNNSLNGSQQKLPQAPPVTPPSQNPQASLPSDFQGMTKGVSIPPAQVPGIPGLSADMASQLGIPSAPMGAPQTPSISQQPQSMGQPPSTPSQPPIQQIKSWTDITPMSAPTQKTKEIQQRMAMGAAGLDKIGEIVSKMGSVYGGVETKATRPWLQDIYSDNPKDVQRAVNYYVAQVVAKDDALLRLFAVGAQPGARGMEALSDTVMGRTKVDLSNVPGGKKNKAIQEGVTAALLAATRASDEQAGAPNPGIYEPKSEFTKNIVKKFNESLDSSSEDNIKYKTSFNNKEEFQKYFSGLSSQQKKTYLQNYVRK